MSEEKNKEVIEANEISTIKKQEGHTYKQWTMAILGTANMTFLTYGIQAGWTSPMTQILKSENSPIGRPLTENEVAWVGSLPSLAGVFGVLVLSYIVERYGRKAGVQVTAILQLGCWVIKLCPSTIVTLLIARALVGLAGGGAFNVVPIYVKEISQDDIRGTLGILIVVFQYFGVFTVYALAGFLNYYTVLWVNVGIPALTALLMIKAPESPAFLVKTGKINKAAQTIANLRGLDKSSKVVQNEINTIKNEDEYFKSIPNISFIGIFRVKVWRKGFLILLCLTIAHALNGAFTIITYASTILATSGVTFSLELQTLSIPIFMLFASFVSMSLVEKLGRRTILAAAFLLSAITFAILGSILLIQNMGYYVPVWIPTVAIIAGVCLYAFGVASMPFVIMSEMFNFQIRAKLMACLITCAWFMSFIQLLGYSAISTHLGAHYAFFGYSIVNLFGFIFCIILLPETMGKSVEEIERKLENK